MAIQYMYISIHGILRNSWSITDYETSGEYTN